MANDSLASAAIAAEGSGNWEAALGLWRQARLLDPHDSRIVQATARCLRCLGRHPEATVLLEQQLRLQPEALPLQLAVVEGLIDAGEVQQALRQLQLLLQASGDAAALTPLLDRLARLLLPADHPALVASPTELLQALQPVLPGHLLLLDGFNGDAVAAVATQLEAPGWQQLGPVPGPWVQAQPQPADAAALQALVVAIGSHCAGAAVVVVNCALAGHRALWQALARQRGVKLAVLLVISHPLQILQRLRRQGIETQQALLQWLQWHEDAEASMGTDPWQPFDVRRLPVSTIQALPWVAGRPPEPALLLQVLDRHDALLNPAKPAALTEPGSVADAVQLLSDRAVAAQKLGDALLAEWLLRLALELMPQHRGLYAALARCLRDQQRLPEAEALLNHHLADDPLSAPGWIGLAEVARELGRWQMAIDHYARALALDPGHGGLPRALRHTAARMLPPSDPRLEGTAQELLTCLRPGLPQCWLIVLDLYGSATSPPRHLRAAYGVLLQDLKHPPDDPSRLTLAVTAERLERLLTALQADVKPLADRAAINLLIDERQVSLQPLWNVLVAQRGLDAGVVLVNRPPLEMVHRLVLLEGLTVRQALFYWIHHQLEAEAESRHLPRVRVDVRRMQTELGLVMHDCESLLPGPGSLTTEQRAELQLLVEADQVGPVDVSTEDMPLLTLALGLFGALCDQDEERCRGGVDHAASAFLRFQAEENRPAGPSWRIPVKQKPVIRLLRRHLLGLFQTTRSLSDQIRMRLMETGQSLGEVHSATGETDLEALEQRVDVDIRSDCHRLHAAMASLIGDCMVWLDEGVARPDDQEDQQLVLAVLKLVLQSGELCTLQQGLSDVLSSTRFSELISPWIESVGLVDELADDRQSLVSLIAQFRTQPIEHSDWLGRLARQLGTVMDRPSCAANDQEKISPHLLVTLLCRQIDMVLGEVLEGKEEVALLDFQDHWNTGDSAIWLGQLETLKRLNKRIVYQCSAHDYDPVLLKRFIGKGPILLSGGGNLGDLWLLHQLLRERVLNDFPDNPIVQLPQSICFNEPERRNYFKQLIAKHKNFTLMTRDLFSYELAQGKLKANTILSPDMAFGLGLLALHASPEPHESFDVLWLRRADKEGALGGSQPEVDDWLVCDWLEKSRLDDDADWQLAAQLSHRIGQLKWSLLEADQAEYGLAELASTYHQLADVRLRRGLKLLSRGHVVLTDRLHAHILALMLGKPTVILDNTYQKLWGAYNGWTSIARGATWAESEAAAIAAAKAIKASVASQ